MVDTLDTTDHERAARERRRRREPSRQAVDHAAESVASHNIPGTIYAHTARIIRDGAAMPFEAGTRTVRDFSIRRGDPRHGAKRSDDHLGRYEVEFPLAEADDDAVPMDKCPQCGSERGLYEYSAYHHIAGGDSITCLDCQAELYSEEWG